MKRFYPTPSNSHSEDLPCHELVQAHIVNLEQAVLVDLAFEDGF